MVLQLRTVSYKVINDFITNDSQQQVINDYVTKNGQLWRNQ